MVLDENDEVIAAKEVGNIDVAIEYLGSVERMVARRNSEIIE
jgi:hypothetical protein